MKKFTSIVVGLATITTLALATTMNAGAVTLPAEYVRQDAAVVAAIAEHEKTQETAHQMAECARELGLDESHETIVTAKEIWSDSAIILSELYEETKGPKEITISMQPHMPTKLSAAAFNKMLEGTPMAGTGEGFVRMEERYGTNGLFAIGVAGSESGIGAACYGHNPYGMLSRGRLITYSSWEEATMAFGKLIDSNIYARASSIGAINQIYCPGDGGYWSTKVNSIMNSRLGKLYA